MMEFFFDNPVISVAVMAVLAVVIRVAVPRMMKAEKEWVRAALGVAVFAAYTGISLLTIGYFAHDALTVEDCLRRACVGFLVGNVMVLFAAAIFFFTREKRTMSQEERMKLKDL